MTIRMVDQQGNAVVVDSPGEAMRLWRAGTLGFVGDTIPIIDASGSVQSLRNDPEAIRQAFGAGIQPATEGAIQAHVEGAQREQRTGSLIGLAQTVQEGLEEGVAPGLATQARVQEGLVGEAANLALGGVSSFGAQLEGLARGEQLTPEEIAERMRERREDNAALFTGAEIAGAVAGARGPTPVGGAAALGGLAERAVLAGTSRLAERGAAGSLAARALGTGAAGLTEGAIFGAGHALSEDALGRADLTADRLAAGMGMGALLGFGGGAALGAGAAAGGDALRAAAGSGRAAAPGIQRLWQRSQGTRLREGVAEAFTNASSLMGFGGSRQIIRESLATTRGGQRILRGEQEIERGIGTFRQFLDDGEDLARLIQDGSVGNFKRSVVRRSVLPDAAQWRTAAQRSRMSPETLARLGPVEPRLSGSAQMELLQRTRALGEEMVARPRAQFPFSNAPGRRLIDFADGFGEQINAAVTRGGREGAADLFIALDKMKRRLGAEWRRADNSRNAAEVAGADEFQTLYHRFRNHLEDTAFYGEAANIQREVNATWTPFIANARQFSPKFMSRSGEKLAGDVRDQFTGDPRKIARHLNSLGTGAGALDDEIFRRHVRTQQALNEAIVKNMDLPPELAAQVRARRASMDKFATQLDDLTATVEARNQFRELQQTAQTNSQLSTLLPAGVGLAIGGPGGALAGAGLAALARPDSVIRAIATIEQIANTVNRRVEGGVAGYIRRSIQQGRAAVGRGANADALARRAPAQFAVADYEDRVNSILEFTGRPQEASERIAQQTEGLAEAAPNVHTQTMLATQRGAAFLRRHIPPASLPRIGPQSMLPRRPPSDVEIDTFMRYVRAVDSPTSIIDDLEDGRLSAAAVEAMRAVYPAMYEQVVSNVVEAMAEEREPVPYEARLQLSTLLGVPFDPSLEPQSIQRLQISVSGANVPTGIPEEQAAGGTPPAPSARTDLAGNVLSDAQGLEQRRTEPR